MGKLGFLLPCIAVAAIATPSTADACGGLFCDRPPPIVDLPPSEQPMPIPIDQTGEDILFAVTDDAVEVQVQIQYEGDADEFAWIIPMLSPPVGYGVGSDALLQAVKAATQPVLTIRTDPDPCALGGTDAFTTGLSPSTTAPGTASMSSGGGPEGGADVVVFAQTKVGVFDIVVLSGTSAAEVLEWLDVNGYAQDPEAEAILDEYLAEGHVFAAVKLHNGADVDEVHPIVFRFDHAEPCVPLRLTRIASVDDLQVRVYYLGDHRAVPTNYRHVVINPVALGISAGRYASVVAAAVDVDHADGRAFVTEWAGSSNRVPRTGIRDPQWNPQAFVDLAFEEIGPRLEAQDLYTCDEFGGGCGSLHPLVDGLLAEYLPVPEGLSPDAFYGDLAAHIDEIDAQAWGDGSEFAAAMQERIVDPGEHALELLDTYPYLTRLFTLISPHEMTEDPIFHQNADLEDTPLNRVVAERLMCSGDSLYTLDDGREVFVPRGSGWPSIPGMPAAEDVEDVPTIGAPIPVVDNTQTIDELLAAYNASVGWPAADDGGGAGMEGCGCRSHVNAPASLGACVLLVLGLRRRQR
jgi:hypothetical protein